MSFRELDTSRDDCFDSVDVIVCGPTVLEAIKRECNVAGASWPIWGITICPGTKNDAIKLMQQTGKRVAFLEARDG